MMGLNSTELKKLGITAGIVGVIIITYYGTGIYRNYLQIKKLKKNK